MIHWLDIVKLFRYSFQIGGLRARPAAPGASRRALEMWLGANTVCFACPRPPFPTKTTISSTRSPSTKTWRCSANWRPSGAAGSSWGEPAGAGDVARCQYCLLCVRGEPAPAACRTASFDKLRTNGRGAAYFYEALDSRFRENDQRPWVLPSCHTWIDACAGVTAGERRAVDARRHRAATGRRAPISACPGPSPPSPWRRRRR